ncbi:BTB/POZ domain and ankyrin repeat-containing protein NPR1 [Rhododendron vialii]|uniref:BTB/POZ domain and ankyrin repeat-containing protein NPR1 n=1 Tax=Rhododendron vialii TaxID=182163 RepID=UPI00265EA49B|nr:BTB/POZ domain and ankyrin repeat-containing protein NPR1 [Rhododendron vialii]
MDTVLTPFSDSNDMVTSGSSSISYAAHTESLPSSEPEIVALRHLSRNLDSILTSDSPSFSDAKIAVAGGREIQIHRCILSARSPFFKNIFSGKERGVKLELKDLAKDFEVSFDALVTVLVYLYSGKVRSARPEGVCVCVDDECDHVACRPAVDFLVEVLYASFVFEVTELVALYQRHLLDILDKIAADDILVVLSLANICGKECDGLLTRCIENIVRSDVDIITLDRTLPDHIVKRIVDSRKELGFHGPESSGFPDKHVKRIHRALDSDDVELVRMLLKEGHTSIDDAYALHYAVAYCDAKTTTEILDLAIADVNHRNLRGYTVLHIAAIRKEPKIIVSLLTKGAEPAALTSDGRKALKIAKRLTRAADYYKSTDQGKASPKDRLCIEILEQAERRDPLLGEASASLAKAGDDLRMKLLYLENRVGLAKLLFPMEAKVAMDIAQVDGTSEFTLASINSKNMVGAQRITMDLNDAPFKIKDEHLNRIRALSKTVELGKRFFPRCSEVLNKMMDDDDWSELAYIQNETQEERQLKKRRYMELQDVITKAFHEDKEEFSKCINIQSSSSSTSIGGVGRPNGKLTLKK